jgi:hypothetical protein
MASTQKFHIPSIGIRRMSSTKMVVLLIQTRIVVFIYVKCSLSLVEYVPKKYKCKAKVEIIRYSKLL